jgi:ribosomal protein S18 acetylase RimI-like enzyme
MRLEPFPLALAGLVAGWALTREEVGAWCARAEVPVPTDVVAGWSEPPDVEAFAGRVRGQVVAYGELWLDADEGEVELARLIVAPSARGQGLGVALTRALVERARADHPELAAVVLRVRASNAVALRAYAAAGFVPVGEAEAAAWNVGQPEAFAWMRMP